MTTAAPLLSLKGIEKTFGSQTETTNATESVGTHVLRGVDFELESGASCAVLGPSGSGKSTLLNIIGTLEPPTAGSVRWEGRDLLQLGPDELASFRNREIGFVFQRHHLLPQCTALENVLLPTLAHVEKGGDGDRAALEARAEQLLERVGLAHRAGHRPAQLSGGECQRVAVVRALINRPRLILADEPTGSLDAAATASLGDLFIELNERDQVTLLLVTHSQVLAGRMRRVVRLDGGRLTSAVPGASEGGP